MKNAQKHQITSSSNVFYQNFHHLSKSNLHNDHHISIYLYSIISEAVNPYKLCTQWNNMIYKNLSKLGEIMPTFHLICSFFILLVPRFMLTVASSAWYSWACWIVISSSNSYFTESIDSEVRSTNWEFPANPRIIWVLCISKSI